MKTITDLRAAIVDLGTAESAMEQRVLSAINGGVDLSAEVDAITNIGSRIANVANTATTVTPAPTPEVPVIQVPQPPISFVDFAPNPAESINHVVK